MKPTNPINDAPLIEALETVLAYCRGELEDVSPFYSARLVIADRLTGYAMGHLIKRLVSEGYTREDRADELRNRSRNMQDGHGFLTDDELSSELQTPEMQDLFS